MPTNRVSTIRRLPLPSPFVLSPTPPSLETYFSLRTSSGLSAKTPQQAQGIFSPQSSSHWVYLVRPSENGPEPVGMGRVFSDLGWYYIICDIAVLPPFQGKGLGDYIVGELMAFIKKDCKEGGAYVSLVADGEAKRLYFKHGFRDPPKETSVGMAVAVVYGDEEEKENAEKA